MNQSDFERKTEHEGDVREAVTAADDTAMLRQAEIRVEYETASDALEPGDAPAARS